MEFIFQNPLILLGIVLMLLILSVYFISKTGNKKSSNKKTEDKKEAVSQDSVADGEQGALPQDDKNAKKKKLKKLKPEITRVYEKKQLQSKVEKVDSVDDKSAEEEELLKRMQFVKSSGKVSKLKPYVSEKIEENFENVVEEQPVFDNLVQEVEELKTSTHFDRTRRLSKMIKDDTFDDMFCSHISEKYMNMDDIEKHIRNCSEIQEKLYHRAAETMANSEVKVSINDDGKVNENIDRIGLKSVVEEKKREALANFMFAAGEYKESVEADYDYEDIVSGEVDLSARNILVVDALLKRKGKKS